MAQLTSKCRVSWNLKSKLNFDSEKNMVVQTCFLQQRNISRIVFLSTTYLEKVIHVFTPSHLKNTWVHTQASVIKLKTSAAQLSTGTTKRPHNPHLIRIDFKILLLTYKAVNGLALVYMSELMTLYMSECSLRSSNKSKYSKGDFLSEGPQTPIPEASQPKFYFKIFHINFLFNMLSLDSFRTTI